MILVVDNLSGKMSDLRQMLNTLEVDYEVKRYDSKVCLDDFNGVILSGRRLSSPDTNRFNSRIIRYAESRDIPLLGICYGGEVLATTFGGSLIRLDKRIDQFVNIRVNLGNSLTQDRRSLDVCCRRRLQISHLPDKLIPLSSSKLSVYEIVKHRHKDMFGLQFHPESSNDDGRFLLQNFISMTE